MQEHRDGNQPHQADPDARQKVTQELENDREPGQRSGSVTHQLAPRPQVAGDPVDVRNGLPGEDQAQNPDEDPPRHPFPCTALEHLPHGDGDQDDERTWSLVLAERCQDDRTKSQGSPAPVWTHEQTTNHGSEDEAGAERIDEPVGRGFVPDSVEPSQPDGGGNRSLPSGQVRPLRSAEDGKPGRAGGQGCERELPGAVVDRPGKVRAERDGRRGREGGSQSGRRGKRWPGTGTAVARIAYTVWRSLAGRWFVGRRLSRNPTRTSVAPTESPAHRTISSHQRRVDQATEQAGARPSLSLRRNRNDPPMLTIISNGTPRWPG